MTHEALKNPIWLNHWVWQTELVLHPADLLSLIRTLEVRDVEWGPYVDPTDNDIIFWANRSKKYEMWHLSTLLRFSRLEKLYFTCYTRFDNIGDQWWTKEAILDYLEEKKVAFHGSRVPEVIVRSHEVVSFHSL